MDLFYIINWWLIWLVIGIVFLPITSLIFANFFDRGYIFSKILGILAISYVLWIIASLGILPFNTFTLFFVLAIFSIISTWLSFKTNTFAVFKGYFKTACFEELLFLLGLVSWSFVRGFEPSIHGLEKYMDYGFINSILRSESFPPKDLWLTPLSINYYYFGHLAAAVLTKISGLNPAVTYNLYLASLFAITISASFSLGANLYSHFTKTINKMVFFAGLLSAFLITLGGNLHTIYIFFQTYTPPENPVPFWTLPFQLNIAGYWYPNATRFIPNTIHEFPLYSFVVADLHGHVLNIPFVLLTLAILIKIFFSSKLHTIYYILLGLLIAIFLMTNVLDGPIYLLVIFTMLLAINLIKKNPGAGLKDLTINTIKPILVIIGSAIAFSLPFWISFKPFSSGIGVLCAPQFLVDKGKLGPFLFEANHCMRSPFWMETILWGFAYFIIFGFLFFIIRNSVKKLIKLEIADIFVIALAGAATILIIIPEFVYVKDIYPAHYRANTLFKFGYQAFMIFGLISGYMITRILTLTKKPIWYLVIGGLLFMFVAIYPYFAINSYYGVFSSNNLQGYKGLDGLKYLAELYPSDYKAILWLNDNIKDQPVILEAQGDSYTDFARVSSNTGLPTVVGWPVHEWLWRGSYDEAGRRSADVTTLYESTDINLVQQLLKKYNVEYVFIGTLERQKYTKLNENTFYNLGKTIFQDGETRIYQIQ